jgi:predicted kinase
MKCPREVAGTIRRDRIRNTDIRKQLNMIPVQERRQQGHHQSGGGGKTHKILEKEKGTGMGRGAK